MPDQTPLFYALQNQRYARRQYIEDIEGITGRKLIVYFSKPEAAIEQPDVMAFGDLLHNLRGQNIDLLLQSSGGDIDVAEKLVNLMDARCRSFRVIVAESAKSAATLMALASDEIVMSDTSELGPIDPQVTVTTAQGQRIGRPASSFLDGLTWIQEKVEGGELSSVFFPLLTSLDPALLDYCRKAIERSERFAEKWLLRSQCKDQAKAAKIAKKLADTKQYPSHGTMIDHKEAEALGLKVKYCQHDDELWQHIWRLYCMYEIDADADEVEKILRKLHSLAIGIAVPPAVMPQKETEPMGFRWIPHLRGNDVGGCGNGGTRRMDSRLRGNDGGGCGMTVVGAGMTGRGGWIPAFAGMTWVGAGMT